MKLRLFRLMQMLILLTVASLLGPALASASFICKEAHSGSNRIASTLQVLRSIEPIAEQEAYHARHRFSAESLAYLRDASGNPNLTHDQLLSLYANNYLLLAFRANNVFVDMVTENIFAQTSVEKLQQLANEGLKDLALETSPKAIKQAIQKAVRETTMVDFTHEELVGIVQIFALDQAIGELYRLGTDEARAKIKLLRDFEGSIVNGLSPSLRNSLGIEKRSKTQFCCQGGCKLCPLSVGLKREVKREGGALDAHLSEVPGVDPPDELELFKLIRRLKFLLPQTNW